MPTINPTLLKLFHQNAVSKLPNGIREVYQYIEDIEAYLEGIAINEKHFMRLMVEQSPIKAAANYFSIDIEEVKRLMRKAQQRIDQMIHQRCSRMKWIDFTDMIRANNRDKESQWLFVFDS